MKSGDYQSSINSNHYYESIDYLMQNFLTMKKSRNQAKLDLRKMLETLREYEQSKRPIRHMGRFAQQYGSSEEYMIEAKRLGYIEPHPDRNNKRGRTFYKLNVDEIKQHHVDEIYNAASSRRKQSRVSRETEQSPDYDPDELESMKIKKNPGSNGQSMIKFPNDHEQDYSRLTVDQLYKRLDGILREMKKRGIHSEVTTTRKIGY